MCAFHITERVGTGASNSLTGHADISLVLRLAKRTSQQLAEALFQSLDADTPHQSPCYIDMRISETQSYTSMHIWRVNMRLSTHN